MAFFSTNSGDYAAAISALQKPTYTSKYNNLIDDQLNKILNREEFSYDFNADPLYQQYKDQYTKLGKEASMNAAASASALTGGYGNSYAGTAASQANQQYLTELNNQIPQLMSAAMDRYKMQTDNLYNQFGVLEQEEGRQYGMYRDKVSDYYSDLSNLMSGYGTAQTQENANRDYNYRVARDAVADSQWQKSFDYNAGRDTRSDYQWDTQFAYQQARDAVADSQWQKEYELALKKARSGGSGGGTLKTGKYTTDKTWQGGLVQEGRKKVRFTQNEAETQVGKLDTKEEKEHLIDTWLDLGYISENDAAILMDKFKL